MVRCASLIAAISLDGVIAVNNKLPWSCPRELCLMKSIITKRKVLHGSKLIDNPEFDETCKPKVSLIMGRRTFESIKVEWLFKLGCEIAIVSSSMCRMKSKYHETLIIESSIDKTTRLCNPNHELFYFGGHDIYKECIDRALCSTMYISRMNYSVMPTAMPTVLFPKISNVYERVAKPIIDEQFSLEIYMWCQEYCSILTREGRRIRQSKAKSSLYAH